MRETSTAESYICRHLRLILASLPVGASLQESEGFDEALVGLARFIPEVLQEIHLEWKAESLDEIYPALARKTGDQEIEIVGLCCLLSDQTLTPLYLRFQLAPLEEGISWLECRLGEKTDNGMRRAPYTNATVHGNMLHVMKRLDSIDWFYSVGYGERAHS